MDSTGKKMGWFQDFCCGIWETVWSIPAFVLMIVLVVLWIIREFFNSLCMLVDSGVFSMIMLGDFIRPYFLKKFAGEKSEDKVVKEFEL